MSSHSEGWCDSTRCAQCARDESDRVIGTYRIPLTPTRAQALANLVGEWPDHELSVEGAFLVVRETESLP